MGTPLEDYYAILQVQPDAEPEVIDAAYRQLMRKYHPDVAGTDAERAAVLHERAKSINRAYAVLRDPGQRWIYDHLPTRRGASATARPGAVPSARSAGPGYTAHPPGRGERGRSSRANPAWPPGSSSAWPDDLDTDSSGRSRGWGPGRATTVYRGPLAPLFNAVSSLYYFLPGPYEWERQRGKDLLATLMLPPLGLAAWSLFSGRLNLLTGHAPSLGVLAWGMLGLLALPLWPVMPRLVLAGLPTVALVTGLGDNLVRLAGVPVLFAWVAVGVLGIIASARLYLFAVLPTVVLCWLLANAGRVVNVFGSGLSNAGTSFTSGQLGAATLAVLLVVLTWLTVLGWGPTLPPLPRWRRAAARPSAASPSAATASPPTAPDAPLFRRLSADRVRALQVVPLRTDRAYREPPTVSIDAQQEASVVLVKDTWAFLQTDDGREGWAEWRVTN